MELENLESQKNDLLAHLDLQRNKVNNLTIFTTISQVFQVTRELPYHLLCAMSALLIKCCQSDEYNIF